MSTGRPNYERPDARNRALAKTMGKTMTEAEKKLWWELRHRLKLTSTHFRRQVAIGPYIADFCCLGARVIVEVDGGQHYTEAGETRDAVRSDFMMNQGFTVLRFTNATVFQEIDSVIETIAGALSEAILSREGAIPTPDPSPQGGGEITGVVSP